MPDANRPRRRRRRLLRQSGNDRDAAGGGLYTLQALWTQAREGLDVTDLICSNRRYRILQVETLRAGIAEPGANARGLTDLSHPEIDWAGLGRSLGVRSVRVETTADLARDIEPALSEPGPHLIEMVI